MNAGKSRLNVLFWAVAVFTVVWVGFGDRMLTHWAYAVERGRIQAGSEELAQLADELPEVYAVSRAFKLVAKIARPGVVHIRVSGGKLDRTDSEEQERIRKHLRDMIPEDQLEHWLRRVPPGSGSGIIFDSAGYILTNNHVVEGRDEIFVVLHDEREFKAAVVGTDPKTDLAVIKIDAPDLHPLKLGDSDALEVGDWVIAVGSPFGLQQTVTHGIVSAIGRSRIDGVDIHYQDFIQTDAAINPGNSGGPLLNLRGEVVGVNTAIATHGDGVNAGIAFTIPSNMAIKVANQLKTRGEVRRGYLGIVPVPVRETDLEIFGLPSAEGVLVEMVVRRSPADRAGLQVEDVIMGIDDVPITGLAQFRSLVADLRPNQRVRLRVLRDREEVALRVRLGLQPDSRRTPGSGPVDNSRKIARLGLHARTLRAGELYQRGYDEDVRGVYVASWNSEWENPPAIGPYEVIVACNGKPVKSVPELNEVLKDVPKNRKIRLTILEPTGDRRIISIKPRGRR
ncbi:MAG: trypsin-like peptidase domain-containing protein [Phycisphaerae bacterium]|nr:trypsin-like peptidase domain-containing protein [Phycisphaerae bacterium]